MTVTEHNTSAINRLLLHKPQSLSELVTAMTHYIYVELRSAIELRKFNDGTRLTQEQLDNCLQLMILYEEQQLPQNKRTGFNLPINCKAQQVVESRRAELQSLISDKLEQ